MAPGERIAFKASCAGHAHYHADIVRLVSGDLSPAGPGFREELVPTGIAGIIPAGRRKSPPAPMPWWPIARRSTAFPTFPPAMVWPTTPGRGPGADEPALENRRLRLAIDAGGALALILDDGRGGVAEYSTGRPLLAREWYLVAASFDAARGR